MFNNSIKLILLGDSNVGKTQICYKYTKEHQIYIPESTIGVEFYFKLVSLYGHKYKINIWDTAGQERFKSLVKIYFKDSDAAIIVFDITSLESFKSLQYWLDVFQNNRPNKPVFIVANKIDLINEYNTIDDNIIKAFLSENFLIDNIYKVSAKNGTNIKEMFNDIIDSILKQDINKFYEIDLNTPNENDFEKINLLDKKINKRSCCGICP